ncbi:Homeodomain-like protein [Coniochaeta ligniaria NRRL 30616]|uniref:Homeodomain-like protein n=1 Tax=Coniochaeta ligniaria NRRL 30616 TaxID=1408157 RepID=A0A1J7JQP4_9PEZI|nr:Homeodomain-like protein [Coniochaeta ligniaria NRRL 30616]
MADVDEASTPRTAKERHSLTLDQRRALRRWANTQAVRPSHKACIDWFRHEYDQTISQSTVSHSLSPKYARLDGDPQLSGSRLRFGNWPDVEKLVLLWYQQVVNSGRHPSNDELGEKAKSIFSQLPRYKDESPPEFSPGWIHRFKKRYGLLIRRQRRHGSAPNPADDLHYLVDAIPRFMSITAETPPSAIRDAVQRVIMRRMEASQHNEHHPPHTPAAGQSHPPNGITPNGDTSSVAIYADDDPEIVLQNALRALQQEEAAAEAEAEAVREARDHEDRGALGPLGAIAGQAFAVSAATTPAHAKPAVSVAGRYQTPVQHQQPPGEDLTLTPIQSGGPVSGTERPVRCPYCLNRRMLHTIKDAVEHMSTHVVV